MGDRLPLDAEPDSPPGTERDFLELRFFLLGILLLLIAVAFAGWAFYEECLSSSRQNILRWALPLASGFAAWSFSGSLHVRTAGGLIAAATGGFAVWLITIYILIPTSDAGCGEAALPPTTAVIASKVLAMRSSIRDREWDSGLITADQILELDPDNVPALNAKGTVAFYRSKYLDAVNFFEKVVKLRPGNGIFLSNLADTYVELGRLDDAISIYRKIEPVSQDVLYELGRAYVLNEQYKEATTILHNLPSAEHQGRARVMEAAAWAGRANREDDSSYKETALLVLKKGVAKDRDYWETRLVGNYHDIHEPLTRIRELLNEQIETVFQ
tara:strand:- start:11952 stop:12935 length:984 start_codon:yes stop_codon:yes gene_type:complete